MVRSFLNGRFENTAFVILDPDAETRLSGTGRSPEQGLTRSRPGMPPGRGGGDDAVLESLEEIAKRYRPRGEDADAVLQDFHSFRQALNVASGDQRLLVFVAASANQRASLEAGLAPVMNDEEVIGRFHLDFGDPDVDRDWSDSIEQVRSRGGIFVIRADPFGQSGSALASLPLEAGPDAIKQSMLEANLAFAESETRKVYSEHVAEGRRERVFFEGGMPYGEDRDGDGEIDKRGGGKGKGKGKGEGGPR